jgi:hypothetical protein
MKKALLLCLLVACTNEDNLGNSIQGTADWSLALGGRGYESGTAAAVDSTGSVLVGGTGYLGAVDFGGGVVGNDNRWAFLLKRSGVDGAAIWTVPMTGLETGATVEVNDIAMGANDSVYAVGEYMGTVQFGGDQLVTQVATEGDMFVAKYASDGTLAWLRGLGHASDAYAMGVVVDASDNVFVTGSFAGAFEFAGRPQNSLEQETSFVASYTVDGNERWINLFDPAVIVPGLALSPTDDIVVLGRMTAPVSVGGAVLPLGDYTGRGFVARYHGDGSYVWSRVLGSDRKGSTEVGRITVDASDTTVVDGGTALSPEGGLLLLQAFAPAGGSEWIREDPFDGTNSVSNHVIRNTSIAFAQWVDSPYNSDHPDQVTGHLQVVDLDEQGVTGRMDIGERLVASLGGTGFRDAAVGPRGELALVGDLGGELQVGGTTLASHGTNDTDVFVVLVPAD